jgi:hypothetical protein
MTQLKDVNSSRGVGVRPSAFAETDFLETLIPGQLYPLTYLGEWAGVEYCMNFRGLGFPCRRTIWLLPNPIPRTGEQDIVNSLRPA